MGADQNFDLRRLAASSFDWWRDAGLDVFVDEAPRNWLAQPAPSPMARAETANDAPTAPATPVVASLPATLVEFEAWRLGGDTPDANWSQSRIAPRGDAGSGLMVLIEIPERDDEQAGMLLSGTAGRLFDRMLAAIGRDRETVYLASLAVARPASGRVPPEAIAELGRLARHQIGLVAPKRLLVIGNATSRAILGADIAPARGKLHDFNHETGKTGVVASYHPRFLLERPAAKAEAWRDLQLLMKGAEA
ncbi:MAG: uracil-DNA glycosylase [Sphingomonas sp.]